MSKGKLITGIVAGAAAGAIVGILMAPDKGSETRKKIAKKGNDLSGSVKDGLNKITNNVSEKYNNLKSDAKDLANRAKAKQAEIIENHHVEKAL